jgi:hypothetical protein
MAVVRNPVQEAAWHFEYGERLEAAGRFDDAFQAFADGNAIRRSYVQPQIAARLDDHRLETNLALCTREYFIGRQAKSQGHPSAAPFFVIGMPRSGTTLIEQILVSHRDVRSVGESNALASLVQGLPVFEISEPDAFRRLGARYLEALRQRGWKASRRVVDKSLANYIAAPLLKLVFPRAHVVHIQRDPLDTCLSIFKRNFEAGNENAYALADIAGEYRRHRRAMQAWRAVMPGEIVEVSYEALATDPQAQIRRLIAGVGLAWDPDCLRFDQSARRVTDGDGEAVRRPIDASRIGLWRHYRRHLAPLIEALGPDAPADAGPVGARAPA